MDPYSEFARIYDFYAGERDEVGVIRRLLNRYEVYDGSLLELACGTGAILAPLSLAFDVWGIDKSPAMLQVARRRVAHGRFRTGDMRTARLSRRFDAVICVFNSINHLLRFRDWERTFAVAHRHLKPGGVFLFDMNTALALKNFVKEPPLIEEREGNLVLARCERAQWGQTLIHLRVFQRLEGRRYYLHESTIRESSFPIKQVEEALTRRFTRVTKHDPDRSRVTSASEVVYFVCRK